LHSSKFNIQKYCHILGLWNNKENDLRIAHHWVSAASLLPVLNVLCNEQEYKSDAMNAAFSK
jgi:hypothetical protein